MYSLSSRFHLFYNFPWSLSRELVLNDNEWLNFGQKQVRHLTLLLKIKNLHKQYELVWKLD